VFCLSVEQGPGGSTGRAKKNCESRSEASAVDEKRFRFDLMIALGALLISGIAAGASAYQTYVIRKQFSATVWPYLTYITSSSTDKYFELDVSNPGIGPALVLDATITRDGKPVERPVGPTSVPAIGSAIQPEVLEAKGDEAKAGLHNVTNVTESTILPGDVIPAGQKLVLLRVEGKLVTRRVLAKIDRVDLTICYCSLLGDCWTKRLQDTEVKPHPVRGCKRA
jgi:hypothetical protein